MTERIDIAEPVRTICERLGFDPGAVLHLDICPGELIAVVALRNENGNSYITATGEVAKEAVPFKVRT